MTAPNLTMPMIQCSSCGSYIAHLIADYKKMTKVLDALIEDRHDFNTYSDKFISNGIDKYKTFIQRFYLNADEIDRKLFSTNSIIIYALLDNSGLLMEDFPFRSVVKRYRWCCSRMFLCDTVDYY